MIHRLLVAITCSLVTPAFAQVERGAPLARKAALGAGFGALSAEEAKSSGLPAGVSAKIVSVVPNLTGSTLGLKVGDIVLKLADRDFQGPRTAQEFLRSHAAGEAISIIVQREGKSVALSGKLIERPKQKGEGLVVKYDQVLSRGKRIRVIATYPATAPQGKPLPVVFMVGGIGAYSLDGEFTSIPYGNILGPLSKEYVTVRIDKPGQGDSEGPEYTSLAFDDELDAYLQAVRLVKTFPDVDKDRIAIFGHSMGGAFGPLVASQEKVAGLAVSGTMSKTWVEYQLENTRRQALLGGASPAEVDEMMRPFSEVTHYVFNKGLLPAEIKKIAPELASAVDEMSPDGKTYSGVGLPFFQQLAKKNLIGAWSKFEGSALALWGANDFISTEWDHKFIADTINQLRPGKGQFKVLPESDHGFNKTASPLDSMQKWGRASSFNPNVVETLKEWLAQLFPAK